MPAEFSEIIDVVSVTALLAGPRISGAPQLEQKRDVSGFGRLQREQKMFGTAPFDLPSCRIWSSGSRIASGTVAERTESMGRGSTRRANSLPRPPRLTGPPCRPR